MKWIVLYQSTLLITYLFFITKKFGWLDSWSESYYMLKKGKRYIFSIFLILLAAPLFTTGNGFFFFAAAFLCFTAIAAAYKESLTDQVHYIGAVGSILLSSIGLWVSGIKETWIAVIVIAVLALFIKVNNKTFWIEILCFAAIQYGLLKL